MSRNQRNPRLKRSSRYPKDPARRARPRGPPQPHRPGRGRCRRCARKADETAQNLVEEYVKEPPALTIGQRPRLLKHITSTPLSDFTFRRLRKRLGFSQKMDYGGGGMSPVVESRLEAYGREGT